MAINDAGMFTVKEINRLKILQDVIDRNIRPGQAAEMLGITPRHCSRLLKRYRQYGPLGMNNQSRGRTGNRLLPASLTDQALSIIREHYRDFGPTLAREAGGSSRSGPWKGNHPTSHDKGRTLDSPQTTRTENSSASLPASLYWRADTN